MVLYVCPAGTNIQLPGDCDDLPTEAVGCRGGQIFGSWAILWRCMSFMKNIINFAGFLGLLYPEGVALPVGGPNGYTIVLLEVHYDNPGRRNGKCCNGNVQITSQ